jgi:aminomethyltransferase
VGRKALEKQHEALLRIQNKNFSDLADLPRRILPIALLDKGVMRSGMQVYNGDRQIGFITSGTMIPYHVFEGESGEAVILNQTGKRSIGLAILDSNTAVGDAVQIDVRGRRLHAVVTARHMRADGPFARPVLC